MKKITKFMAVFLLVVAAVVGLVACNPNKHDGKIVKTTKDAYAFSAVTAVEFLATKGNSPSALAVAAGNGSGNGSSNGNGSGQGPLAEDNLDTITKYLSIFEDMLSGAAPISSTIAASDKEGFAHKMTVETKGISGEVYQYQMYYNESLSADGKDFDEDDADETETVLDGIMIIDGAEYILRGKKEVEQGEMEVEFEAVLGANKVIVKQEIEADEQEFCYQMFENGVLVSSDKIELEIESGETKVEIETEKNGAKSVYAFTKKLKGNGSEMIKIHVKENGNNIVIHAKVTKDANGDAQYEYQMNSGKNVCKQKQSRAGKR